VSAAVKYTLARLALFAIFVLLLWPVGGLSLLLKLMIAVLASAGVSWFALRGLREQVAVQVQTAVDRRREEKERLRTALAGQDDAPAATEQTTSTEQTTAEPVRPDETVADESSSAPEKRSTQP
jgi:hypothetical protein